MNDLLIHNQSQAQLLALANDPPHALLIVGPTGIGKARVASAWAVLRAATTIELIEPDDKGTIGIDAIRELYQRTRSKRAQHQVVIIDHAEAMGVEAQNAFLKLLEEPRADVTFILTAPHGDVLLPTVVSRVQTIQLLPIADKELAALARTIKKEITDQQLAQLLFVAQGRPAILQRLLSDKSAFAAHSELMQRAKRLMTASLYERLTMVNDLIKDKTSLIIVLEALMLMTKLQIAKNPEKRWLRLADGLQTCLANLAQNGNPRVQLLRLLVVY